MVVKATRQELQKHLLRLIHQKPTLTISDCGSLINQSVPWIIELLGLEVLLPQVNDLMISGSIVLQNAYALAKIPLEKQLNYLDEAKTQESSVFVSKMKEVCRVK